MADAGSLLPLSWDGGCTMLGTRFCAVNPLPVPAGVNAIDATAEDDVWIVGAGSLIAHFDGDALRVLEVEGDRPVWFMAVDAVRRDCAWAAGGFAVARWDGQRWRYVADAPDYADRIEASDCDHPLITRTDGTAVYRWDGTAWQTYVTAAQLGINSVMTVGVKGSQVWVAGAGNTTVQAFELTDAGFVDRTPTVPDPELYALGQLYVQPDAGVLAFDRNGFFYFKWEGGHWSRTELSSPAMDGRYGVDAQGRRYALQLSTAATIDGGTVTPLGPPLYRPVYGGDFQLGALGVTPNGDLWVGGEKGELARYHDGTWRVFSEGPIWSRISGAQVGDEVWTIGGLGLTVLNQNGVVWRDLQLINSTCEYFAIDVLAPDDVWLGGYEYAATRPVLHWNGQAFSGEMLPMGLHRISSFLHVGGERWAVSQNIRVPTTSGVYARETNGSWREVLAGTPRDFTSGWGDGSQAIIVGYDTSDQRVTRRYRGGVWAEPTSGPEKLNALAGPDVSHLYAVGLRTLHRFDDGAWTVLHTFSEGLALNSIVVRGDELYATGLRFDPNNPGATAATLVHWRDGGVEEHLVPGVTSASGLFFTGDTLWLVGVDGAIIKVVTP